MNKNSATANLLILSIAIASLMCGVMLIFLCRQAYGLTEEERSWRAFCDSTGHLYSDDDPGTINEYLDTWRGSTAEEQDPNQ